MAGLRVDSWQLQVDEDLRVYFEGSLFTGTAELYWPGGRLCRERPYRQGLAHGWQRYWSAAGHLVAESLLADGGLVRRRFYYEGGALEEELFVDRLGRTNRRSRWDENGELTDYYCRIGYENLAWDPPE